MILNNTLFGQIESEENRVAVLIVKEMANRTREKRGRERKRERDVSKSL